MTPTLGLSMIVKNEEAMLRRCLDSIAPYVHEMVIVDTGSTDSTVEIVESYDATVYHHPWQNSFSEARNYALAQNTTDWIIQLDADEEFVAEDAELMRSTIENVHEDIRIGAIYTALMNFLAGAQWSRHYFQRIFRREGARYVGVVHNQLEHSGGVLESAIRIRHFGYALDKEKMDAKAKRTGDLLRKQLEENPANTFAQMNLVRILRNRENFEETIAAAEGFLRSYGLSMQSMHRQMIMNDLAYCLTVSDRTNDAEQVCRRVLQENPGNLDVLFNMAVVWMKREDPLQSIHFWKQFLKAKHTQDQSGRVVPLIVDTYTSDDKVWNNIGECFKMLGQWDKALPCYAEAVRLNPNEAGYYKGAHAAYMHLKDPEMAYEAFLKAREVGAADTEILRGIAQMEMTYDIREVPDEPDESEAEIPTQG